MCTHRTGWSRPRAPATTRTPVPSTMSRTVSMSLGRVLPGEPHAPTGLLEHGTQDRLHLGELLRAGDQRRRELDDGLAAVVGAADQPAVEQLGGQETAQQLVALTLVEALLRGAVLDELDRPEVAHAANVADDRQVGERVQHRLEVVLVRAHAPAQVLTLE